MRNNEIGPIVSIEILFSDTRISQSGMAILLFDPSTPWILEPFL